MKGTDLNKLVYVHVYDKLVHWKHIRFYLNMFKAV
jgi:hypothetical protein